MNAITLAPTSSTADFYKLSRTLDTMEMKMLSTSASNGAVLRSQFHFFPQATSDLKVSHRFLRLRPHVSLAAEHGGALSD